MSGSTFGLRLLIVYAAINSVFYFGVNVAAPPHEAESLAAVIARDLNCDSRMEARLRELILQERLRTADTKAVISALPWIVLVVAGAIGWACAQRRPPKTEGGAGIWGGNSPSSWSTHPGA
jgi:hypothetical protein